MESFKTNHTELIKDSKKIISELPKPAKVKLIKSKLCRTGDGGIYNQRRNRWDISIITLDSFVKNHEASLDICKSKYTQGFYVLNSPNEYENNRDILDNIPLIVEYTSYKELDEFPIDISNIKKSLKDYSSFEPIFVVNIKDLDKHKNKGGSMYIGPENIGQYEMDYATEDECEKIVMVLLYEYIKMYDFKESLKNDNLYEKSIKFAEKFEKTEIYQDNPKLIEYTKNGTRCAMLSRLNLKFSDIINGTMNGDVGRKKFNRTTTKINLHHVNRLIAGQFNHNHKNVFLGSAMGNMIDAALNSEGITIKDLENLL